MMETLQVREARDEDVAEIRELFIKSYGPHYRYREFYDDYWLKKTVYSDNYLFLVAAERGRVRGTASIYFDVGAFTDLLGEFGRLVVDPDHRQRGIGTMLMESRLQFAQQRLHFGYVQARTTHSFAQQIAERHNFHTIGFLPLKSLFNQRESIAVMAQHFRSAQSLRRNHPRLIPEIFPLAAKALNNMGLVNDLLVIEDAVSYPSDDGYEVEELTESGLPHLLRIERGRLKQRQVFGNLMLSYGYFALQAKEARYLVAKSDDTIVGAIGYVFDRIGKTINIIELIDVDDAVGGFLLKELDRRAREELDVVYAEVVVSAYWPRIQRTLDHLGFCPVAYCPAYVFRDMERLDAIRMAKLYIPCDLGEIDLIPSVDNIHKLVMRGFQEKRVGIQIDEFARGVSLFKGLSEVELHNLATICQIEQVKTGDTIFSQGDTKPNFYMVLSGGVDIRVGAEDVIVGRVVAGDVLGEISLVERLPHSATAVAALNSQLIVLKHDEFDALIKRHPRIGVTVMRNLARSLGNKLKAMDSTVAQFYHLQTDLPPI